MPVSADAHAVPKVCTKCKTEKTRGDFPQNRNSKDGRHCWCSECQRASVKEWRRNNAEKARAGYRRDAKTSRKHVRRYGIEPIEYERMLENQGGVCAICGGTTQEALAVDHCHDTDKVRGLLCKPCNWMLGNAGDDPDRLLAAAAYLLQTVEVIRAD